MDGEDSGGIGYRMVSVKNPNNGLFRNCVVPNSNIAECRILWTEEARANLDCSESRSSPSLKGWSGVMVSVVVEVLLSGSIRIRSNKC